MKAIFFQTKKEKQIFVVFFALLVLGCLALTLWYFFGQGEGKVVISPVGAPVVVPEMGLLEKFDFSILENRDIKDMILFSDITMPEEFGRENPFEPF